jgi:RNA polymerase primary sigma factor
MIPIVTRRTDDPAAESDTLRVYLREIATLPMMTPAEEHQAGLRIQQGDEHALNALVEANLRFVVSYSKRYRGLGVGFLDLIHEGNLGLIEAARRFDPARNVKFITYAVWWIRQAIVHTLSDQGRIVALPERLSGPAGRLAAHVSALSTTLDRPPTSREVAEDLEISEADVDALLRIGGDEVSLSDPIGRTGDLDIRRVGDVLPQRMEPPVEESMVHRAVIDELKRALIQELNPHERKVMMMRFGFENGESMTLQEVGERLVPPISRERVRQIEERAKEKLRHSRRLRRMRGSPGENGLTRAPRIL